MSTVISTKEAMALASMGTTRPTIISWVKRYNLGKKRGGMWAIDKKKFMSFLQNGSPIQDEVEHI